MAKRKGPTTTARRSEAFEALRATALAVFLEDLSKHANVGHAAKVAQAEVPEFFQSSKAPVLGELPVTILHARNWFYEHRRNHEDFARAWDDAVELAIDDLEREAWRRARKGVKKPVFQGGALVGTVREYSDTLMKFMLRGHRAAKYGDSITQTVQGPGGGPVQHSVTGVLRVGGTKTPEEWAKKKARASGKNKESK